MSHLDDLHTLVRLLQEFELPVSPILEYSIKEKEEELMQTSTEEHTPISFEQEKPIVVSKATGEQKAKGKSEVLRVEFPNGKVVQCNRATDTYVEVIEYAGPSAVSALGITHAGVNIVADTYDAQYASAQRRISDGWLVFTNTSTRQKHQDLVQISERLSLDIIVNLISTSTGEIIEAEDTVITSTRQKIEVLFPNGKVIQPNRVYEAVVEVVKYAGPERVRDLNIIACGDNLVLRNPKPRYITACKSVGNGWFVNTCSDTQRKYEQICHISNSLHLGISAKIIGGEVQALLNSDIPQESYNVSNEVATGTELPFQSVDNDTSLEEYTAIEKKAERNSEESGLNKLLQSLLSMKVSQIKGSKSPHKAIYILTIMEGISEGVLSHNKICLDTYLIQTYMKLWEKYVPAECPYTMDLCNPYMYLSSEPFYFLHFTVKPNPEIKGSWGISSIKRVCDYAYISDEFYSIIRSVANRIAIKSFLINRFNLVRAQDQPPVIKLVEETAEDSYKVIVPTLPKPKIRNQRGAAIFRISYPNGIVVESDSYSEVYVQFVKYAGPQRIRNLNIRSLGANIIATLDEINKRYEKHYKDVGGGYFFNTISSTQRKYEVMTYISAKLNLKVEVELLPNN